MMKGKEERVSEGRRPFAGLLYGRRTIGIGSARDRDRHVVMIGHQTVPIVLTLPSSDRRHAMAS